MDSTQKLGNASVNLSPYQGRNTQKPAKTMSKD